MSPPRSRKNERVTSGLRIRQCRLDREIRGGTSHTNPKGESVPTALYRPVWRFGPKSFLTLEIGDEDPRKQCHLAILCHSQNLADGDCTNPFREGRLNRFWPWRSGMETFSKVANQCHFVPFPRSDPRCAKPRSETPEPITHDIIDRPGCPEARHPGDSRREHGPARAEFPGGDRRELSVLSVLSALSVRSVVQFPVLIDGESWPWMQTAVVLVEPSIASAAPGDHRIPENEPNFVNRENTDTESVTPSATDPRK